jgi:hypothetical protein
MTAMVLTGVDMEGGFYAATGLNAVSGTGLRTPLVDAAITCILQSRPDFGVPQRSKLRR